MTLSHRLSRFEPYLLVCVLFSLASAVIWIRTATVKATYQFVQREKELIHLQQEIQTMRLKWLKVTSPKRLESLANNLGLFPPKIHQVLKMKKVKPK